MSLFQLDPQSIAARVRGAGAVSIPSPAASVSRGIIGFTLVSIAGFAPWAVWGKWFHRNFGEAGMYAVCAIAFIGLSGPLLHRLIIGPGSLARFYKLFSAAFAAYSVAWIVGYMSLHGHPGSITGLLAGNIVMGWMLAHAFDARGSAVKVIAMLFLLNTAGYFAGGWIEGAITGTKNLTLPGLTRAASITAAKLLWGVCYGIGFGAGLGLRLWFTATRMTAMMRNAMAAIRCFPTRSGYGVTRRRTVHLRNLPGCRRANYCHDRSISPGKRQPVIR